MAEGLDDSAEEIRRLKRCVNGLVGVLAVPALWTGGEPSQIMGTLIDVLRGMLRLDFVYVRMLDPARSAPIEMAGVAPSWKSASEPRAIGEILERVLGASAGAWPSRLRVQFDGEEISIATAMLGLHGEAGTIVAASEREDFPQHTERLILGVTANQAAIGLQEAKVLNEQKRIASQLDQRVAQRTRELAMANETLKKEVAERRAAEVRLSQEEEQLRRSQAFLAEAQRLSSTGSFSWRVRESRMEWSEQLYRIFEFDPAMPVTLEAIGARVHPDDAPRLREMTEKARNAASDLEYEYRLLMPDHSVKYLHLIAHGTRNPQGQLEYIGAVQDVTRRRIAEDALSKAHSELAHMARAMSLGVLTASITHEVSQPLAGIVTNAGACIRMLAAEPANVDGARETVRRTIRDANRAADVVARLRALFAKRGAPTEPIDLNDVAGEVIALSQPEMERNRVVLQTGFAGDLPLVTGDRVQIQQVILNLFTNACDAMTEVEDRPRSLIVRTRRGEDDHARLSVEDAGTGIAASEMNRLFEAFYTTKSDGMGMGLSVSRSIIERHHGRLWAEPNVGPGTTFIFSIPTRSPRAAEGAPLHAVDISSSRMPPHGSGAP